MIKSFVLYFVILVSIESFAQSATLQGENEIIYGRKDGMALTMVMNKPAQPNGKAVVWVVSGNWISSYAQKPSKQGLKPLLDKGYTVFEVIHGSQPKYNIEDALGDIQRAVRFIRYNAADFKIDPQHIGISGSSAGGHLSLLVALMDGSGRAADKDPINRVSSKVQAAAVFYPPTDFSDWGGIKDPMLQQAILAANNLVGAFDFRVWDSTRRYYISVADKQQLSEIAKSFSPTSYVSKDDPPVFLYHGDKDRVVPLQQSQLLLTKLKDVNVASELKIKPGADHGWKDQTEDINYFADWFDKYLK